MGKTFTFRADPDLVAVLEREARANETSVSRLVRDACREQFHVKGADVDRRRFNRFVTSADGRSARLPAAAE